MDFELN